MLEDLDLNPYADLEELDLREELLDLIAGTDFGKEKFIPYIFREKRSLPNGKPDRCVCWNEKSNEGRVGCGDCGGEGILWDESIIPGFLYHITTKSLANVLHPPANLGRSEAVYVGFIVPYEIKLKPDDHIIIPKLSAEGTFQAPYEQEAKYYVNYSREYRLDYGKKEFTGAIITRAE
jgi:hypothetical protein